MTIMDHLTGNYDGSGAPGRFSLPIDQRADLELNDAGNAARLLAAYGDDLIFVTGRGWGVWDGNRYSFGSGAHKAAEIAARLPVLIKEEIAAAKIREWDEVYLKRIAAAEARNPRGTKFINLQEARDFLRAALVKRLTAHSVKCGNVRLQKTALISAEWQVLTQIQDLDREPYALVCQNGVVDLRAAAAAEPPKNITADGLTVWRTPWIRKPDRSFKPTKCAAVPFVPSAAAPEWERFIQLILPDPQIRACLQRCLGALLFGENPGNAAIMLRGGGGNGKSTLINIISDVLGARDGYAAPAKIEMFIETQNQTAGQATPEEVELPSARAILASEPGVRDVFDGKKIKALTGGDLRPARALGKEFFFYRPQGVPVIQFNRTPRIKDEDEGLRRRLVFLPLEVNLHELPADKRRNPVEVMHTLRGELPGVLNWMLDGFRDFHTRVVAGLGVPLGIDPPHAMLSLKDQILESADPVGSFLKSCADIDPKGRTRTSDFFRCFKNWARDNGARIYSDAALRDTVVEKGFPKIKSNGLMVFTGFKLRQDEATARYLTETPPGAAS